MLDINMFWLQFDFISYITTPICVQVHFMFHYIFNEITQIYHGENGQFFNKYELVGTYKWIH
jgi:hypothetical protein